LDFGSRPIDLISEDDIGHDRPDLRFKAFAYIIINFHSYNICREHIRSELDPFEVHAHDVGKGMNCFRLCQTGNALYQHMASAEHIDDDRIDEAFHADDLFMDFLVD
jgi:hypothetical protein